MIRLRVGEGVKEEENMKAGSWLAARRKGYGGERTSLWALKKLNWTNASQAATETQKRERNGLPGKWPSSLLYMGRKSVPCTSN